MLLLVRASKFPCTNVIAVRVKQRVLKCTNARKEKNNVEVALSNLGQSTGSQS